LIRRVKKNFGARLIYLHRIAAINLAKAGKKQTKDKSDRPAAQYALQVARVTVLRMVRSGTVA
jgi:hypothetical protein